MKQRWFRPWGWIYYPVSWQGIVLVLLTLAFCVQVFLAVDRHSHSASDTLYVKSGLILAPPTSAPSISGCAINSLMLSEVTLPP